MFWIKLQEKLEEKSPDLGESLEYTKSYTEICI